MASQKRVLGSPTSPTPLRRIPPSLLAAQSSSLTGGPSSSYPVTTPSYQSSPDPPSTQSRSSQSPDLLDDFRYSPTMAGDFQRLDAEVAAIRGDNPSPPPSTIASASSLSSPTPPQDQKTWVVFRGKGPGLYNSSQAADNQTKGFSDAFQRAYPNRASAEIAWDAFNRDGIYPDYGKGPWVVFHGRRPGVFERVSELEGSVKGYSGAIFRPCASLADGNVKFHVFTQRVTEMFAGSDLYPNTDAPTPPPTKMGDSREVTVTQSTPTPTVPKHPRFIPQVAESSSSAQKREDPGLTLVSPMRRLKIPRPGDGWYVVYNGVLPGVYYGSKALKEAGPRPGGFKCAPNEDAAHNLFLHLAMNDMVIWTGEEE